jgi:cell division protein FtsI/penicillin-binding protein 2
VLALLGCLPAYGQLAAPAAFRVPPSLHAQSTQFALAHRWPRATNLRLSWLVLDLTTGLIIADQGFGPDVPMPVGSLTKPILALAYARTHNSFPQVTCHGTRDRCWLPRGHGSLGIEAALAHSCNAYFLRLASQTDPRALEDVLQLLGLPSPPAEATPAELVGLDPSWKISPASIAHAYASLLSQPDAGSILAGLRQAASEGSASALFAEDALAKTGTAPCHLRSCIAGADGLVIAITPIENPRTLLLVRQQGTTGAATANLAAEMLHLLKVPHEP